MNSPCAVRTCINHASSWHDLCDEHSLQLQSDLPKGAFVEERTSPFQSSTGCEYPPWDVWFSDWLADRETEHRLDAGVIEAL